MKKYREVSKEMVYKFKRIEDGVECDICGKFIKSVQTDTSYRNRGIRKYYRVMTGHHEWGNDSCDSIEYHDVCPECIDKFVSDYLKNGCDSAYIDIDTMFTYPHEEWVDDMDDED